MIRSIRKRKKQITFFLAVVFFSELITPSALLALTSGPTQPEVQSFQPAGTSDMVDLFSGDFSYNIPLFELPGPNGGYPFNLSYQSGIGMDQEASWVGLGWNLNPGAITRQMRGLPDEFKGDPVYTKMSMNPSVTVGIGTGIGVELFGGSLNFTQGFSVNHNNYKGIGYSIDGSVGFGKTLAGMTGGIGLNIGLDSKEGVNVNPSLNLGYKALGASAGAGYNSKAGLSNISMSLNVNGKWESKNLRTKEKKDRSSSIAGASSSISLAHPGYTPQISMPMRNISLSATFKAGGAWWGVFGGPYVNGFYNEQWLKHNNKRVKNDAYGYLNYQHAVNDAGALLDFNREKDGMVMKESPNLAIPFMTYDIYSVAGQGISAMYRPMRNDFGMLYDPEAKSTGTAASAGVDVGPGASHVGVNLSVNHSKSVSGAWTDRNDMRSRVHFMDTTINQPYEPWYFKVHGELNATPDNALADVGGDHAVRVKLINDNRNATASADIENRSLNKGMISSAAVNQERQSRNQVIQPITNQQLLLGGQELLSWLKIEYFDQSGNLQTLNRSEHPKHHIAAFTALTPEGLRYNYGIPAFNLKQEEIVYSVLGQSGQVSRVNVGNAGQEEPHYAYTDTEKFLKRVELPRYTHSHLLTSILGPDYVDVTGDGVTEDDLGYWVKFTYRKTTTDQDRYKWRDPYSQAHLQEGWKTDPRDDKGSFTYGEKEIWYLARAETKSHIAIFEVEEREDGKGVAQKLQDINGTGKSLHRLKAIRLFTRSVGASFPIKVARFEYDYSLCPGVYNNSNGGGKLTLKKVWFEYGNSQRGALNPYVFTYHTNNPSYDMLAYDRWGNYKPYPAGQYDHSRDFPYVPQDPLLKEQLDNNAAAWSIHIIELPSGGRITIDYETDDYGYVQHLPAMQMMEIVAPSGDPTTSKFNITDNDLSVRFKLESPISGTLSAEQQRQEVLKYLDQKRKQLFFKLKINLRSPSENFHEHIYGYADIDMNGPMKLDNGGSGDYKYGVFRLIAEDGRHPFSLRAWQHLRTNQPELANSGRKLNQTNSTGERVKQIKSLGSVVTQARQMFQGFYTFCSKKNWGREIVAGKSWIRLNSPDKIKYGGGLRVKQITIHDQWNGSNEGIYGQYYDYTIEEEGRKISSGVAAYEPIVGGEENPLRYAKKFVQAVRMRSDNNLFFEYPINESYYPGPQVGYRKVTVMSLPSARLAGKPLAQGQDVFPQGSSVTYGTSGQTVHEFYTAKDFPVLTDETDKVNKPYRRHIPIPLLGSISISRLTTSQGYSVVTNNMHGKPRRISNYRQDRTGHIEPEPMSWVQYNYLEEPRMYEQEKVFAVKNSFQDNGDGTLSVYSGQSGQSRFSLGQETEFFMDMREYEDKTWGGGVNINVDVVVLFIAAAPIPTVWPNISKSEVLLRTAVTNKVIFKAGILRSTEAYDGGSRVTTQHIKWDKNTGVPVLSIVNNNFDAPVFSYSIPAYTQYQGMGAASRNIGLAFTMSKLMKQTHQDNLYVFSIPPEVTELFPGDELILYGGTGNDLKAQAKAVYLGYEDNKPMLYCEANLTLPKYKAVVMRSGYRNQLTVMAGQITALEDPSVKGETVQYTKTISVPQ
jgi:hypothetical protein